MEKISNHLPYHLSIAPSLLAGGALYLLGRSPLPVGQIPLNTTLISSAIAISGCQAYNACFTSDTPKKTAALYLLFAATLVGVQRFLPNRIRIENTRQLASHSLLLGGAPFAFAAYQEFTAPKDLSRYWKDNSNNTSAEFIAQKFKPLSKNSIDDIIIRLNDGRLKYSSDYAKEEFFAILANYPLAQLKTIPLSYGQLKHLTTQEATIISNTSNLELRQIDKLALFCKIPDNTPASQQFQSIFDLVSAVEEVENFDITTLPSAILQLLSMAPDEKLQALSTESFLCLLRILLLHNDHEKIGSILQKRQAEKFIEKLSENESHQLIKALCNINVIAKENMYCIRKVPAEYFKTLPQGISEMLLKNLGTTFWECACHYHPSDEQLAQIPDNHFESLTFTDDLIIGLTENHFNFKDSQLQKIQVVPDKLHYSRAQQLLKSEKIKLSEEQKKSLESVPDEKFRVFL